MTEEKRGRCAACRRYCALTKDGLIYTHGAYEGSPPIRCTGSGKPPAKGPL